MYTIVLDYGSSLTFFFVSVSVSVPFDLELMGDSVPLASRLSSLKSLKGDDVTYVPSITEDFIGLKEIGNDI